MEKKFPNSFTKVSTFKIIELPAENSSPMEIDLSTATIPKRWTDDNDYTVFLENNDSYESDSWTHDNQLYMFSLFQVDDSLNFLIQSI